MALAVNFPKPADISDIGKIKIVRATLGFNTIMSSSSLADYLASKYLSKDQKSNKKKSKRKHTDLVKDTSASAGWENTVPSLSKNDDDDDDDLDAVDDPKVKHEGWKSVNSPSPLPAPKSRSGLQSAEDIAADVRAKQEYEQKQLEAISGAGETETVYRDATGRRVDLQRQLEASKIEEQKKLEHERLQKEINLGLVQQRAQQDRQKQLEEIKDQSYAVHRDDAERNRELKEREVFNDPMAAFSSSKKSKKSKSSVYQGSYAPNRFNIPPGHRWDGVDRSNGFEQKWFRAQSLKQERKSHMYAMQLDD